MTETTTHTPRFSNKSEEAFRDAFGMLFASALLEAQTSGEVAPFEQQRKVLLSWLASNTESDWETRLEDQVA